MLHEQNYNNLHKLIHWTFKSCPVKDADLGTFHVIVIHEKTLGLHILSTRKKDLWRGGTMFVSVRSSGKLMMSS